MLNLQLDGIVRNALVHGMLAHAYLFTGQNRSRLNQQLETTAAILLCDNLSHQLGMYPLKPCGKCSGCVKLSHQCHPDIYRVMASETAIKVSDIKKMRSILSYAPLEAQRRVCLIPDCEKMNREAANALLKTLEEPPENTHILLATISPASLLPTIVSRCQTVRIFGGHCDDGIEITPESGSCRPESWAFLMAVNSGDAESAAKMLENGVIELQQGIIDFIKNDVKLNIFFRLTGWIASSRETLLISVLLLETLSRDIMLVKHSGQCSDMLNAGFGKEIKTIASCYEFYSIEYYLQELNRIRYLVDRNVNRLMLAERALVFWIRNRNGR